MCALLTDISRLFDGLGGVPAVTARSNSDLDLEVAEVYEHRDDKKDSE